MKKLFIYVITLIFLAACSSPVKTDFIITGTVDGLTDGMVLLEKRGDEGNYAIDTAMLTEGKFEFVQALQQPEAFYVRIEDNAPVLFLAGDSDVSISMNIDDIKKVVVTGSLAHDQYKEYNDAVDEIDEKMGELYEQFKAAKANDDMLLADSLDMLLDELYDEESELLTNYLMNNNKSFAGPYIASRNLYRFELPELEKIVNNIDTSLKDYIYVKKLNNRVELLRSIDVGQPAIDFKMADTDGNPVTLSSYKGKYVLVDFWASWCGPCRKENPNVVAVYNEFKDSGFDVLGVSLDKKRDAWLQAIEDDNLSWTHVSELTGWKCSAGKLYGVLSIPSSVLIDPEGIIIGRNLRGDDLREKVASVVNQ